METERAFSPERQLYKLKTDPDLRRLVAPLDPVEYKEMEENIKCYGGIKGVMVWENIILVDYEYYNYCHNHNIPFCLINLSLRSEVEAVTWVCKNQLNRKFLPEEMKKYLIGKRSQADRENNLQQFKKVENNTDLQTLFLLKYSKSNISKTVVREKIGKEYNLAYITVKKYEDYAKALDIIYRFCPEFVNEHLTGKLKMSIEKVGMLSSLSAVAMNRECRRWLSESVKVKLGRKKGKAPWSSEKNLINVSPIISIKDMPSYDPDSEIISLALTIPSWQSSINRVKEVINIKKTSQESRVRLIQSLIDLNTTAYKLIRFLKEGSLNDGL